MHPTVLEEFFKVPPFCYGWVLLLINYLSIIINIIYIIVFYNNSVLEVYE